MPVFPIEKDDAVTDIAATIDPDGVVARRRQHWR